VRGPDQGGQPGPIESIDATYVNFGALSVSGFDFDVSYKKDTNFGELSPSLSVTQIYKYRAAITPNTPTTDRLSMANDDAFAPRSNDQFAREILAV
jgi:hypothetical protein